MSNVPVIFGISAKASPVMTRTVDDRPARSTLALASFPRAASYSIVTSWPPVLPQAEAHPNRGVAARRADLEHALGPARADEDTQKPAVLFGDGVQVLVALLDVLQQSRDRRRHTVTIGLSRGHDRRHDERARDDDQCLDASACSSSTRISATRSGTLAARRPHSANQRSFSDEVPLDRIVAGLGRSGNWQQEARGRPARPRVAGSVAIRLRDVSMARRTWARQVQSGPAAARLRRQSAGVARLDFHQHGVAGGLTSQAHLERGSHGGVAGVDARRDPGTTRPARALVRVRVAVAPWMRSAAPRRHGLRDAVAPPVAAVPAVTPTLASRAPAAGPWLATQNRGAIRGIRHR